MKHTRGATMMSSAQLRLALSDLSLELSRYVGETARARARAR